MASWAGFQLWQEIYFKNIQSVDLETQSVTPGYAAAAQGLGLLGIYVDKPDEIGAALDRAFAHDGPSVVEVRIDDRATPIHSFKRRLRDVTAEARPRARHSLQAARLEGVAGPLAETEFPASCGRVKVGLRANLFALRRTA